MFKYKKEKSEYLIPLIGYFPYILFFILPLGMALSFIDIKSFSTFIKDTYYHHIFIFTITQAILSGIVSIIIGLPGAYIFSRCHFKSKKKKKFFQSILTIPFVLPTILVVLGFVIAYGNSGFLNSFLIKIFNLSNSPIKILYTLTAVIMAHSFCNFPLVINNLGDYIKGLDAEVEESARLEGIGEFRIFLKITLPRLYPALFSVFILIFLYCYTSFSIVLVLGGKPTLTTVGLEIYSLALRNKYSEAGMLSLISVILSLFIVFFIQIKSKKTLVPEEDIKKQSHIKINIYLKIYLLFILSFTLFPIISIFLRSFIGSVNRGGEKIISFRAYYQMFKNIKPIFNSFIISLSSALFATIFSLCISSHLVKLKTDALFNSIISVSLSVSSVILGFGYMLISKYYKSISPFILISLSHSVISIPVCLRLIYPTYKSIPSTYHENALVLGASYLNILYYVDFKTIKNSILSSFLFSFALSNGDLGTSLLIGGRSFPLLSVQIYRLINSYNYQGACAYGTVMLIITFFIFLIKE